MPRFRKGSCFAKLDQCTTKLDRNQRVKIVVHAEALERATKPTGTPSGVLGQTGLRVLRCLLYDFHSIPTGLCDPSYKAIQRKTGFCNTTISRALQRLQDSRIITVIRRIVRVGFAVEQQSNAYLFHQLATDVPAIPPAREEPLQKVFTLKTSKFRAMGSVGRRCQSQAGGHRETGIGGGAGQLGKGY